MTTKFRHSPPSNNNLRLLPDGEVDLQRPYTSRSSESYKVFTQRARAVLIFARTALCGFYSTSNPPSNNNLDYYLNSGGERLTVVVAVLSIAD